MRSASLGWHIIRFRVRLGLDAPDEGMPRAEAAVKKALELDDTLAEAHHGMAAIKWVY